MFSRSYFSNYYFEPKYWPPIDADVVFGGGVGALSGVAPTLKKNKLVSRIADEDQEIILIVEAFMKTIQR